MYVARKPSTFAGPHWDVTRDGAAVTRVDGSSWRNRARFTLAGRPWSVTATWTGSRYELRPAEGPGSEDGAQPVARAERMGRRHWTVTTGDTVYQFRRASMFGNEQQLLAGDHVAGSVKKAGRWRTHVEADLPGLPETIAVFALAAVVLMWEQAAAAAG